MVQALPGRLDRLGFHTPGRGIVCLMLFGLLSLTAVQPALAANSGVSHFMVSVQVIHDCQYQIQNQSQKQSVVHVVMSGCSGLPQIAARGFVTSTSTQQSSAGSATTH